MPGRDPSSIGTGIRLIFLEFSNCSSRHSQQDIVISVNQKKSDTDSFVPTRPITGWIAVLLVFVQIPASVFPWLPVQMSSEALASDVAVKTSWAQCISDGCAARDAGDFVEAETQFLEAVKVAERDGLNMRLSSSLEELGLAYLYHRKLLAAEKTLLRAVALTDKVPETTVLASKLSTLGQIYMEEERYNEAETSLLRAITIFDRAPLRVIDPVSTMILLGDCYRRDHKLDESLSILRHALALVKEGKKISSFEGMNCHTQLVETYAAQKNFPQAEEIATTMTLSKSPEERISGFSLLTRLLTRQKHLEKALVVAQRALEEWRQAPRSNSPLSQAAWELAHGFAARADEVNEEAAVSIAKTIDCHSPVDAYWLGCLGDQFLSHQKLNKAELRYKESFALYQQIGVVEPPLLKFLENYAFILRVRKRYDEAAKINQRAQVVRKELATLGK